MSLKHPPPPSISRLPSLPFLFPSPHLLRLPGLMCLGQSAQLQAHLREGGRG